MSNETASAIEFSPGTFRAFMERAALVLRSYAQSTTRPQKFHTLWSELAQDFDDWANSWPVPGLLHMPGPRPSGASDDAIRDLQRALASAEGLRSDAAADAQLLTVLDLKATELDTLQLLPPPAPFWEWRKRIVLAQILRLADVLLHNSDELHVLIKTLEVIQHARLERRAID